MREIENFETGMGAGLAVAAHGIMGAASAIGDAIGGTIREAAYLRLVDALTRAAVRANREAANKKAASKALAQDPLRQLMIHRYNESLNKAA